MKNPFTQEVPTEPTDVPEVEVPAVQVEEIVPQENRPQQPNSAFFVSVRARGMLNAMLDTPPEQYQALHPDKLCRWEYWPPRSDDTTLVVFREAQGFKVVNYSDLVDPLYESSEHQKTTGVVRQGDLVLMAAPREIVLEMELEDAKAAYEDYKLPERTYRDYVDGIRVKLGDGTIVAGKSHGEGARRTQEIYRGSDVS